MPGVQIGRHTPDHAKCVADAGALIPLAEAEADQRGGDEIRGKSRRALKGIVAKLTHLPALDSMVQRDLPESVMKVVLEQLGKVCAGTFCSLHVSAGNQFPS